MSAEIFPIKLRAHETAHYTSSPYAYRDAFLTAWRADNDVKRSGWYAYDVTIHSRTEVSFVAYHMRYNLNGGIGDKSWEGRATVPATLTEKDVERAIFEAAKDRRAEELFAAEARIISGYADEIRKSLNSTTLLSAVSAKGE